MFLDISKPLKPAPIDKGRALALIMNMRRQSCCQILSFIGSRAAGFFRIPLYKGNAEKNAKSRTKKRLPQTGKPGQPQTHPNTGAAFPACMVIISPAGECCKIQRKEIKL